MLIQLKPDKMKEQKKGFKMINGLKTPSNFILAFFLKY